MPRICQAMQDCALSCNRLLQSLKIRVRDRPLVWNFVWLLSGCFRKEVSASFEGLDRVPVCVCVIVT